MSSSRSQVSCGDSAPGSTSASAARARLMPRRPGCRVAASSIVGHLEPRHAGQGVNGWDRGVDGIPAGEAQTVRAGVVSRMPSITHTTSSSIMLAHAEMPSARRRLVSITVAGRAASIQRAPCRAEAENPAKAPCPLDRSQQAFARTTADSSVWLAMYTSW